MQKRYAQECKNETKVLTQWVGEFEAKHCMFRYG